MAAVGLTTTLAGHTLFTTPPLPNPRRLHVFLEEKKIKIAEQQMIDVQKGEHKSDEFQLRNMDGRVPVLQLNDGSHISETVAIAQYIEEILPETGAKLFGDNPVERAKVAMWNRRIELEFIGYVTAAVRYGPFSELLGWPKKEEIEKESLRVANGYLDRLDQELANKKFLALDDRISMADISFFCVLDFGRKTCGFDLGNDGHNKNVERWYNEMLERESVKEAKGMDAPKAD